MSSDHQHQPPWRAMAKAVLGGCVLVLAGAIIAAVLDVGAGVVIAFFGVLLMFVATAVGLMLPAVRISLRAASSRERTDRSFLADLWRQATQEPKPADRREPPATRE